MFNMLQQFFDGPDGFRTKLNQMVDALNILQSIRGDDEFIAVKRGPSGLVVSLNINAILPRIPKIGNGGGIMISGKFTGNGSGNGKYTGKSFTDGTTDVSASGNLAESDFGTLSSTNDCLVLVPQELGVSTTGHDVTAVANTTQYSIYFTGRLVRVNSDGTKVVHANYFWVGC